MAKEILRRLPDGDVDYDGEEVDDSEYNEMIEEWRFEIQTHYY